MNNLSSELCAARVTECNQSMDNVHNPLTLSHWGAGPAEQKNLGMYENGNMCLKVIKMWCDRKNGV